MKLLDSVQDENTLSNIEKNRSEYIRTLHSLGEWNDELISELKTFSKNTDLLLKRCSKKVATEATELQSTSC